MNILVVYDTQFGTTRHLAETIGAAVQDHHHVRVLPSREAESVSPDEVDLLLVGSPTQWYGRRLPGRSYYTTLKLRGFGGTDAAVFDTRMGTPSQHTHAAAEHIDALLRDQGLRMVAAPEAFYTAGWRGLASGEDQRAAEWARSVVEAATVASIA